MIRTILALLASLAFLTPASLSAQDRIDPDVLMQDLRVLAADEMAGRGTGTPGAARAQAYIERRLASLGLEVRRMPFLYSRRGAPNQQGTNVWAMIPGRERPDKAIVISAHYDHVGVQERQIYNGADDNASGVAALLAIAAALQRSPPRHSVILAAFDAEEVGLFGSRAFVKAPPVPPANILLNINLDMIGRSDQGELWAAGPRIFPALLPAVNAAARASTVPVRLGLDYRPAQKFRGGEDWTMRSDQASFAAAGIPFIFFTTGGAPDYHKPSDDAERIGAPFYGKVVATVLDTLRRLDAADRALSVARRHGGRPRWRNPG